MGRVLGLTGGIASGKTTIANLLEAKGLEVIDADLIARELVAPKSAALDQIIQHFGLSILKPDGSLDRKALRACVFNRVDERQWLEALMHPLIRQVILRRIDQSTAQNICLVIPLLKSRNDYPMIDTLMVVDIDESLQVQRLIKRDHIDEALAKKMIASQLPRLKRNAMADVLISNNGDPKALDEQVNDVLANYV